MDTASDKLTDTGSDKILLWGGWSTILLFVVNLLSLMLPSIFLAGSSLSVYTQYFIAETLSPIPFLVFFYFWLKGKKIPTRKIGLCLPDGNIWLATLIAVAIAVMFKGVDIVLIFRAIGRFEWASLSLAAGPLFIFTSGIGRVIVIPFMEELLYRGVVFGYLRNKLGWKGGLVLQAIIFTMVHPNVYLGDFTMILFYFAFGIGFGGLYQYYKSLYPAFVCHSALNYLDASVRVIF